MYITLICPIATLKFYGSLSTRVISILGNRFIPPKPSNFTVVYSSPNKPVKMYKATVTVPPSSFVKLSTAESETVVIFV